MLYDVQAVIFNPGNARSDTVTVQMDADSGDDAASQAQVKVALLADGRVFKINYVGPAAAVVEG